MYPGIELRTMRYIVAVGSELHFSRAAERVHVAQPSLSKQIRNVEEELGVELFKRTRKRVEITEPGQTFIENARQALLYAERAASMARAANAGEQGKLFLGVSPSVDIQLYFRLRAAFGKRYAEVEVQFTSCFAGDQAEAVMRSDLHAGLIELPIRVRGLSILDIYREPLVLGVPRNDRLATARNIGSDQLNGRPLVLLAATADLAHGQILDGLHDWGYRPTKVLETLSLAQAFDFVGSGEAIGIFRESARRFESKRLILKSVDGLPTVDTGIAYRRDIRSALVRNLLSIAREVFATERNRIIRRRP
jgi:DNA-binding transcriptional LysR family regulator